MCVLGEGVHTCSGSAACVCWGRGYTHAVVVLCVCVCVLGRGVHTCSGSAVCVCWGGGYTHAVVVLCVCVGGGGVCSWFWAGSISNGL